MEGYSQDLAYVHDAGFTQLAEQAAAFVIDLLGGGPEGPILDLGCGGGVAAGMLTDAGRPVRGIDLSPAQIEIARSRAPDAEFEVGSFVDAELPSRCAAILAAGEVFNYAFDARSSASGLTGLFDRCHAALAPGGHLVFDSAGPGRVPGGRPRRGSAEGADWAIFYEAREDGEGSAVTREITTFLLRHGHWRREHESHVLHLYEPAAVRDLLAAAGFEVEVRTGYTNSLMLPGLTVFVARRPEVSRRS